MKSPLSNGHRELGIITIVLGGIMALFLLLFGVGNLLHPDVPDIYLEQNTRVCSMVILSSLVTIGAIFYPLSGGIVLIICAILFFMIIINNPIAYPLLLVGLLFSIRGFLIRRKLLMNRNS